VFVVDTNVLVYAADEDSPFHGACARLVQDWRHQSGAWYTTWGILYEFLRVTTHARVMRSPWNAGRAWSFVSALLASPGLGVLVHTDRHADVATQVIAELPHVSGNLLHELHTAILMREHGIRRVYTRDTDFHRFPFLEPIDPAA
jgi:toxin-antitoxin system PIN domain toxin